MKALLIKLFKRSAEPAPTPTPEPTPAPSKRKYAGRKRRYAPKGAIRGDINSGLIEQARRARGRQ